MSNFKITRDALFKMFQEHPQKEGCWQACFEFEICAHE